MKTPAAAASLLLTGACAAALVADAAALFGASTAVVQPPPQPRHQGPHWSATAAAEVCTSANKTIGVVPSTPEGDATITDCFWTNTVITVSAHTRSLAVRGGQVMNHAIIRLGSARHDSNSYSSSSSSFYNEDDAFNSNNYGDDRPFALSFTHSALGGFSATNRLTISGRLGRGSSIDISGVNFVHQLTTLEDAFIIDFSKLVMEGSVLRIRDSAFLAAGGSEQSKDEDDDEDAPRNKAYLLALPEFASGGSQMLIERSKIDTRLVPAVYTYCVRLGGPTSRLSNVSFVAKQNSLVAAAGNTEGFSLGFTEMHLEPWVGFGTFNQTDVRFEIVGNRFENVAYPWNAIDLVGTKKKKRSDNSTVPNFSHPAEVRIADNIVSTTNHMIFSSYSVIAAGDVAHEKTAAAARPLRLSIHNNSLLAGNKPFLISTLAVTTEVVPPSPPSPSPATLSASERSLSPAATSSR